MIVGARNARHVADHQKMCSLVLDAEDLSRIQASNPPDCTRVHVRARLRTNAHTPGSWAGRVWGRAFGRCVGMEHGSECGVCVGGVAGTSRTHALGGSKL